MLRMGEYTGSQVEPESKIVDVIEYESVFDLLSIPYEMLLAWLRLPLPKEMRERLQGELRSRDRAMHNQWVEVCGGEFK